MTEYYDDPKINNYINMKIHQLISEFVKDLKNLQCNTIYTMGEDLRTKIKKWEEKLK